MKGKITLDVEVTGKVGQWAVVRLDEDQIYWDEISGSYLVNEDSAPVSPNLEGVDIVYYPYKGVPDLFVKRNGEWYGIGGEAIDERWLAEAIDDGDAFVVDKSALPT